MNDRKPPTSLPKVTIMIPTFGQQDLILNAVDSALAQDYPNLEVIVADDASLDGTRDVIATRVDSRLRYHRNDTNLGRVGNYRNTLYQLANGDWVVNLDGDDYYTDTGFVSAAVARTLKDPQIVIVAARTQSKSGDKDLEQGPGNATLRGLQVLRNIRNPAYHFYHLATLYNRRAAISTDFYRQNVIGSDWESLYRLAICGKVSFLNRPVGVWRKSSRNASRSAVINHWTENLTIWKSIFDTAIAAGMDKREAGTLRRNVEIDFAYFGYSRISELNQPRLLLEYVCGCQNTIGLDGCVRLLTNWKVGGKFVLSALRYKGRVRREALS